MIVSKSRAVIPLRRVTDVEPDSSVLGQNRQVEVAHFCIGVVAVLAGYGIWWNAKRGRRKHPVRVRQVVQKPEVLELPIRSVEPIPLWFLNTNSQLAMWVCSPACSSHQESIKQTTFAVLGPHEEGRVKQTWDSAVIEIALILIEVAVNAETPITKLERRYDRVIPCTVAGLYGGVGRFLGRRTRRRLLGIGGRNQHQKTQNQTSTFGYRSVFHDNQFPGTRHLKNTGLVRDP